MNLPEFSYPGDTKAHVQNLLVQDARCKPKPSRRWLTLPFVIASTVVGATAAGVYKALTPVNDKGGIRCYYRADLTTTYPVKQDSAAAIPPHITTGIFLTGLEANNNPNPDDKDAGMQQVTVPINQRIRVWDTGLMNPQGITDDLIPSGFVSTAPTADPVLMQVPGRGLNVRQQYRHERSKQQSKAARPAGIGYGRRKGHMALQ